MKNNILSLEQAVELVTAHAERIAESEEASLLAALGRTLAEDYVARIPAPPFDRSPLDGYTFAAAATAGATADSPARLNIIGEECAGEFYAEAVPAGAAVRIMTGGAIPTGCDCVIRQEDVTVDGDTLSVPMEMHQHENYCFAGEDIAAGTLLAKKGERLTAPLIAVLASSGYSRVRVVRPVRIALASTGDELVTPGTPLAPGKIYNSNLYLIAGRLRELGFAPEIVGILPDDEAQAARLIGSYAGRVDLFLTTGGVSVGKKDIMHGVVARVGTRLFWKVGMKPGGPALAYTMTGATATGAPHETLGIALSGNPFAAYATFELIARAALRSLSGDDSLECPRVQAVLTNEFTKPSRGRRFIRAYYEDGRVRIPEQHASGSLFSAVHCNAFIDIPAGTGPLARGTKVEVVVFR